MIEINVERLFFMLALKDTKNCQCIFEENIDLNSKDKCEKTQVMVFENYRKKSHSTLRAKRATFTF